MEEQHLKLAKQRIQGYCDFLKHNHVPIELSVVKKDDWITGEMKLFKDNNGIVESDHVLITKTIEVGSVTRELQFYGQFLIEVSGILTMSLSVYSKMVQQDG